MRAGGHQPPQAQSQAHAAAQLAASRSVPMFGQNTSRGLRAASSVAAHNSAAQQVAVGFQVSVTPLAVVAFLWVCLCDATALACSTRCRFRCS